MWRTIELSFKGKPLIDVNEQGVFYSYNTKAIKSLKLNRERHPYLCWVDKYNRTRYAHLEVAKAFPEICGEWFEGCEVHHKDGNSLNNEASNLIVCTHDEHVEFHRIMRDKKRKKEEKRKKMQFKDMLNKFKENGKYTVHYYCRDSKINKNGLAPIEISIYQKSERCFINTGFFANPKDFNNKIYPDGFKEYVETVNAA